MNFIKRHFLRREHPHLLSKPKSENFIEGVTLLRGEGWEHRSPSFNPRIAMFKGSPLDEEANNQIMTVWTRERYPTGPDGKTIVALEGVWYGREVVAFIQGLRSAICYAEWASNYGRATKEAAEVARYAREMSDNRK